MEDPSIDAVMEQLRIWVRRLEHRAKKAEEALLSIREVLHVAVDDRNVLEDKVAILRNALAIIARVRKEDNHVDIANAALEATK